MPVVTGQASSLAGWLVAQADARPDASFLIYEGTRWSYAEVAAQQSFVWPPVRLDMVPL